MMVYLLRIFLSGISSLFLYVSPPGSCTALHVDRNGKPAFNLLKSGVKCWLTIHRGYVERLTEAIERYRPAGDHCKYLSVHTVSWGFVVTPEFLEEHDIPYCTFVQRAGDLVVVTANAPHMILNSYKAGTEEELG